MDPTSLVVNSILPCVLEYHNFTLSTHLIIAADSASIFTICSSLRERLGDVELDGPCDVEPERKRKSHWLQVWHPSQCEWGELAEGMEI